MRSFLERRDRWGNGYSLWLIVGVAFAVPLMLWSLTRLRLENDVAGWLPEDDPQSRVFNWYQQLFPEEDRVLVSWDDCTLTDPRIERFAEILRGREVNGVREGGSLFIRDVNLPRNLLTRMVSEGIPFSESLRRADGLLIGKGPLCVALKPEALTHEAEVRTALESLADREFGLSLSFAENRLTAPSDSHLTLEDEDGWKLHDALNAYVLAQRPAQFQLLWRHAHLNHELTERFRAALLKLTIPSLPNVPCVDDTWFVPGSMAALSVSFSEVGTADPTAALVAIRDAAARAGISDDILRLGGRPVASTMINQSVLHAAWNRSAPLWNLPQRSPILLSVLVSAALSYIMLRSFRLSLLVQTVSILSAMAATSLVAPTGGNMNMVLVVMPTLLMVISVSGTIHVCNYWKNSGISDPVGSVIHAASVAWLPCFMASITTSVGLASLVVSSLVPVRDFGMYASVGCVISFVAILYLLPALMLYWPAEPPGSAANIHVIWRQLGRFLVRHRRIAYVVNAIIVIFCLIGYRWFRTETKVIRYFPEESRVVQDYNFLEENLSGIASVDTIIRFSREQQDSIAFLDRARMVFRVQEALREHPEVSGTLSLASFLDLSKSGAAGQSARDRRNAKIRENLIGQKLHEKIRRGGEQARGLTSMLTVVEGTNDWKVPGDAALNAAGDEVWRITCQSSIMSDYDYADLTTELTAITRTVLESYSEALPQHLVTGLVPVFLRTQQALLESLINSFGMALLLIGLIMSLLLRSPVASFFAMFSNIFPVAVMFGSLGWIGVRVDIGTMITASVALGIAVDGTLHLITWFRQLIREGHSREDAVATALEHCGPALWQTSAAIGFGLLTLCSVEFLLISRFGWIMCGMIFAALWGDVVLLPALLGGPLGTILIHSGRERKKQGHDLSNSSSERVESGSNPADTDKAESDESEAADDYRAACIIAAPERFVSGKSVIKRAAADGA